MTAIQKRSTLLRRKKQRFPYRICKAISIFASFVVSYLIFLIASVPLSKQRNQQHHGGHNNGTIRQRSPSDDTPPSLRKYKIMNDLMDKLEDGSHNNRDDKHVMDPEEADLRIYNQWYYEQQRGRHFYHSSKQGQDSSTGNGAGTNAFIPTRIQQLFVNNNLIGRDGLKQELDGKLTVDQMLLQLQLQARNNGIENNNIMEKTSRLRRNRFDNTNNDAGGDDETQDEDEDDILHGLDLDIPDSLLHYQHVDMSIREVISYLELYIETLDRVFKKQTQIEMNGASLSSQGLSKRMDKFQFWKIYTNITQRTLYIWDQNTYLPQIMPHIARNKGKDNDVDSIFVSIVSYKDDQRCANTLRELFDRAVNKDDLYVGLVLVPNGTRSVTGNRDGGDVTLSSDESDCYNLFCHQQVDQNSSRRNGTFDHAIYCKRNQIRLLKMNETISFSPYHARFFASKLWFGERWYMQIDSHMHFAQDWDISSISTLDKAKALSNRKPVLSYLPFQSSATINEEVVSTNHTHKPVPQLCGAYFSNGPNDEQMIRLNSTSSSDAESLSTTLDNVRLQNIPLVVVGNLITTSEILEHVPFDPFLPFVSKGEEILMSSRLWTSGYDFFQPTIGFVGHDYNQHINDLDEGLIYWENDREALFGQLGLYYPLQSMILHRIKFLLNYPESGRDLIKPNNLLLNIEKYGLGRLRSLKSYMKLAGLDVMTKMTAGDWCNSIYNTRR